MELDICALSQVLRTKAARILISKISTGPLAKISLVRVD